MPKSQSAKVLIYKSVEVQSCNDSLEISFIPTFDILDTLDVLDSLDFLENLDILDILDFLDI